MNLTFAPRRRLVEYLSKGWRLLPGHEYQANDFAVLVWLPDDPAPITEALIRSIATRFNAPRPKPRSNVSRAGSSRQHTRKMEAA